MPAEEVTVDSRRADESKLPRSPPTCASVDYVCWRRVIIAL
jgi:hypothetical protein